MRHLLQIFTKESVISIWELASLETTVCPQRNASLIAFLDFNSIFGKIQTGR